MDGLALQVAQQYTACVMRCIDSTYTSSKRGTPMTYSRGAIKCNCVELIVAEN